MGMFCCVATVVGGLIGVVVSGMCWETWEKRRYYEPPTVVMAFTTTVGSALAGLTIPLWFPLVVIVGGLVGAAYGVHRLKKWIVSKGKITVTIGRDVSDE